MAYPLLQPIVKFLIRHTFRTQLIMDGELPAGNYIISSNHHSWLDPILLTLLWPSDIEMIYIGPGDVVLNRRWKKWFIGGMKQVALTTQRSGWIGKDAYQMVMQGLAAGKCLLIFPEGDAYPNEGEVMPFYNGVAYFALKKGLPVVPVGLCGTADLYYRKGLIIHIGVPLYLPCSSQRDINLIKGTVQQIQDATHHLVAGYQDPVVTSKPMHWLTRLM